MRFKYANFMDSDQIVQNEKSGRKTKSITPINETFALLENQKMLSFCSHDYLGFSIHPEMKKKAIKYLLQYGINFLSENGGFYPLCVQELEKKFSYFLRRESTLFFASRFEANASLLSTLGNENAIIFVDEDAHLSIRVGAENSCAEVQYYPHGNLEILEEKLNTKNSSNKIIVTESIFSSNGAISNLTKLINIADRFNALLIVDDSHSIGIKGPLGIGLAAQYQEIDVITGSLSKGCGAYGGYVSCSESLRNYLISEAPHKTSYVFPPAIIGAIEAMLDIVPHMEGERKKLEQRSHMLRHTLKEIGFNLSSGNSPLISLSFENKEEAEGLNSFLKNKNILVSSPRILYTNSLKNHEFGKEDSQNSCLDLPTIARSEDNNFLKKAVLPKTDSSSSSRIETSEERNQLSIILNIFHTPDHLSTLLDEIKNYLQLNFKKNVTSEKL